MLISKVMFVRLCRARERLHEVNSSGSISAIAHEIGLSQFQFIRHFAALFGETPHQLRIRVRIDRAKKLLTLDRASITGVCLDVGFSSLGSFSTTFARRVGASPSEYRRYVRPLVQVPGSLPPVLTPGCWSLLSQLPAAAFRNFGEAPFEPLGQYSPSN